MIRIRTMTKSFGPVRALDGLDLDVADGELYAFLGPNGAGKTTTIRILNGLTAMDSGQAAIAGIDIRNDSRAVRSLCGMAAQHANLDGELTVRENLEFHGRLYAMAKTVRNNRIDELLLYVELDDRADSPVKTLSGGMKRRLMIARALLHQPRLLFLDEPTAGLDPAIRRRLWNLIKKVRKDGITIFLTTHYIEEAEFLASRVGFLHHGKLAAEDAPEQLIAQLGAWAVDYEHGESFATGFFPDRAQADAFAMEQAGEVSVRRVNLEDAFLHITGDKVV